MKYNIFKLSFFFFILAGSTLFAQLPPQSTQDPKICFGDIDLFYNAFDLIRQTSSGEEHRRILKEEFIDKSSPVLRKYFDSTYVDVNQVVDDYLSVISKYGKFYESIRESTAGVKNREKEIIQIYKNYQNIYEGGTLADISFAIGFFGNGGRDVENGCYIGCEIMCVDLQKADFSEFEPDFWLIKDSLFSSPDKINYIAAHELMNTQQKMAVSNLLSLSLLEGGADFLGEIISGDHINRKIHEKVITEEENIWNAFKTEMYTQNFNNWLYNAKGSFNGRYPRDMGYYIGYKICENYYRNASDKREAFKVIIEMENAEEFLALSGYEEKFK